MRFVGFGRIENLAVRGGLPSFDAAPLVIRTVKVGGTGGNRPPRPRRREVEMLRCATTELLDHLRRVGAGTVRRIEVAHGKPLFFEVEERPVDAGTPR
jgi:hypothetical protein